MTQPERYEYLVLGGGNGGGFLAWHLAGRGHRTAVIERRWIGGSCPNINCLPSKNEIWSAKVAQLARSGHHFGTVTGPVSTNMNAVRERKRGMVQGMISLTRQAYRDTGAELIMGAGRFRSRNTLEIELNDGGTLTVTGNGIFINVGTHAAIPPVPGLEVAGPMTHIEALELDYVPEHLIVLGGGYVGLELAQAFRRFGSRVTLIEHGERIASREDPDVSAEMQGILAEEGIRILVSTQVEWVEGRSGDAVRIAVHTPRGEDVLYGTDILSAVGRVPNTSGIGLEVAGVELDERGYVRVDERLRTTASDVWGIGECCTDHPQFTHVSFDDFRIIRDNLAGGNRTTQDRLIPYCLFTDPPLARVGLSESEAKRRGIEARIAKIPTGAVLRAKTLGEHKGFLKALVGARDDRILGFTMIGPDAGEVVATVQMAMLAGLPYTALRDAILAHPTMTEGLGPLFSSAPLPA